MTNHDGECDITLWCSAGGMGTGPHELAECFTGVALAPPFDVIEVRYDVGIFEGPVNTARIRVYDWNGTGPGTLLATQNITEADVMTTPNPVHTIALNPPVNVTSDSFCFSVDVDGPIAMTRDDTGTTVPGVSFFIGSCSAPTFTSLDDLGFPSNWCMSARIRD